MHFSTTVVALVAALAQQATAYTYCTFFTDTQCSQGKSDVDYDVHNSGCFSVNGGSMKCHGTTEQDGFRLVQSPQSNNQNCNCQDHCQTYNTGIHNKNDGICYDLSGFNQAYNVWRFVADSGSCDANNC